MRKIFLLSVLLLANKTFCQSNEFVEGIVTDDKGFPLAFVHIGSPAKSKGTISDENGNYKLNCSELQDADEIIFSIVGYGRAVRTVEQLKWESNISLKAASLLLSDIQIQAKRIKNPKPQTLGRSKPTGTTTGHSGLNPYGIGAEWALVFKGKEDPIRLEDINFHTRWNTLDSVLYRIAIYTVKDGQPDSTINQQEIWYRSVSGIKWHVVNLRPYQIILQGEFAIGVEIVRKYYSETGENYLFFSHARPPLLGREFTRTQSQGAWQEGMDFPLTLNVRYLTVSSE